MVTDRRRCLGALLCSALGLLMLFRAQHIAASRTIGLRPYEANQVLDQAHAVYRTIKPEARSSHITLERAADNAMIPYWSAACHDGRGDHVVHLTWDARTGELTNIGVCIGRIPTSPKDTLTAREATARSAHWMRTLGLAARARRWRVVRPLRRSPSGWVVRWRSGVKVVDMIVGLQDGKLLRMQSGRLLRRAAAL